LALAATLLLGSVLAPVPAAQAAEPVTVGGKALVTNTDGDTIRVRAGAGTEYKQVAEAHGGQTVAVLDGPIKDSKGTVWYKIEAPRGKGWMMANFLAGKGGGTTTKEVAKSEAPAAKAITEYGKVANTDGDRLRVRTEASRSGSVAATIAPSTVVQVSKGPVVDKEGIAWYMISVNGSTGWAMAEYLVQAEAPAKPAAPAPAPAAQPAAPAPAAAPAAPAPAAAEARTGTSRGPQPPAEVQSSSIGQSVLSIAMKHNGARYRFGGSSPAGFDCSGFVYYVVGKAGKRIARTIPGQIAAGVRISSKELQPGDLVFFSNTYKRGLSHAGIYIGNGKFIHAQNERTGVLVSSLWSAYWASHYTTAVRLK
jgi:cell wall-associated NlpC family hydrolase